MERLVIVEDEFIVANDLSIMLENAGYTVCATADTVASAKTAIEKYQPTWVLLDIFLQEDTMGTDLAPFLQAKGIGYIYISANTNQSILEIAKATQPYGFLVKPFREHDLLLMLDIARSKHESTLQFASQRESLLQQHLTMLRDEDIATANKIARIPAAFQSLIPFDFLSFEFTPAAQHQSVRGEFYRVGFNEYSYSDNVPQQQVSKAGVSSGQKSELSIVRGEACKELPGAKTSKYAFDEYQLNATLQLIVSGREGMLRLSFCNKNIDAFDQSHLSLLSKTDGKIFQLFSRLSAAAETAAAKTKRRVDRIPLPNAPQPATGFEGIYGNSAALLHVLDNIKLVANTPVSVLILGESGTGKEKAAQSIHQLSARKNKPFITVNCAAMPADLIESELFGHEKGAFTGAAERRAGKFEMAGGGTIFLDEIGEMPPDSQVKLLRVLQEKQFEPIGSNKTISTDVRIIAATNRNLEKEVAEGRFRLDLFYRLNVYPIELPPLRDRTEDIPVLAQHFLDKTAASFGRTDVPGLSEQALQQLSRYPWPGNIRELEHLMARTLIKTRSNLIAVVELPDVPAPSAAGTAKQVIHKTLEDMEAEHILRVLKSCNGKLTGNGGAAEILGLPPSTLTSRMKKLGIKKELYHDR